MTAAVRFFFRQDAGAAKSRGRGSVPEETPSSLTILTQDVAARLIKSAGNQVSDIDSAQMVVHVRKGKGARDRDIRLDPKSREILQEYGRWMRPNVYLFPGTVKRAR